MWRAWLWHPPLSAWSASRRRLQYLAELSHPALQRVQLSKKGAGRYD